MRRYAIMIVVMTQKNTNTANRYMNKNDRRGFWFRENARDRRMTVEVTRKADGSYHIHSAQAHFSEGGINREVTVNPRELRKELRRATHTPNAFTSH